MLKVPVYFVLSIPISNCYGYASINYVVYMQYITGAEYINTLVNSHTNRIICFSSFDIKTQQCVTNNSKDEQSMSSHTPQCCVAVVSVSAHSGHSHQHVVQGVPVTQFAANIHCIQGVNVVLELNTKTLELVKFLKNLNHMAAEI